MAFGGSLLEWKKFVKSKNRDEDESNLSNASCLNFGESSCGDDARRVYEDIIGSERVLPDGRLAVNAVENEFEAEISGPTVLKPVEHSTIEPVSQSSSRINHSPTLSTLMKHVERNDFNKLMEAINRDQNLVNAVDQFGWSLLMVAACAGAVETVKLLLQSGADAGLRDRSGHTCVSLARKKGHLNVVKVIKSFRPVDPLTVQSDLVQMEATSMPRTEICAACNLHIEQAQKRSHITSTVHQLSQCVKGCRTYYTILGDNRGYQLMLKNGWDGQKGLGPSGSGMKLPPKTVLKRDRKGLGASRGTARITHFLSNDYKAVVRNQQENSKKDLNKSQLNKQIQYEKFREVALRRELS